MFFVNSLDPDETAHNEPSHLDLRCLTSSVSTVHITYMSRLIWIYAIWHPVFQLYIKTSFQAILVKNNNNKKKIIIINEIKKKRTTNVVWNLAPKELTKGIATGKPVIIDFWTAIWENVPYDICHQRRLKSACASDFSVQDWYTKATSSEKVPLHHENTPL